MFAYLMYVYHKHTHACKHLHALTCSVVGHRSIAPGFKPWLGYMSEGCFIFHFASLPLDVAQPI